MISLHDELITSLKLQTPPGESPAAMLMNILSIGKEGAYRRLRGEIQLTVNEAVVLAKQLGRSLDNLIEGGWEDKYAFHITPFHVTSSLEEYYYTLEGIMSSYNFIKSDPECRTYIAGRVFSPTFYVHHETFTRFTLFKWIYVVQDQTKYPCLSSVEITPRFEQLFRRFAETAKQIPTTFIVNDFLFASLASDLIYYYNIKALTKEEFDTLKQELLMLIDELEELARRGSYKNGVNVSIYITDSHFDISYYYASGNGHDSCAVGVYGLNFLSCLNPIVTARHKAWIESLFKYSTLITGAGEAQRVRFFKRQRERFNALSV